MTELADRLAEDVNGAFPEFVNAYKDAVFSIALRSLGERERAADIAAETFLRAFRALSGYGSEQVAHLQLRPWIITIALNLCRNDARNAKRNPRALPLDHAYGIATTADPEREVERAEDHELLAAELRALPRSQGVAVMLRYIADSSYEEIASVLGCPTGTARSHVARGLKRLRTNRSTESMKGVCDDLA